MQAEAATDIASDIGNIIYVDISLPSENALVCLMILPASITLHFATQDYLYSVPHLFIRYVIQALAKGQSEVFGMPGYRCV